MTTWLTPTTYAHAANTLKQCELLPCTFPLMIAHSRLHLLHTAGSRPHSNLPCVRASSHASLAARSARLPPCCSRLQARTHPPGSTQSRARQVHTHFCPPVPVHASPTHANPQPRCPIQLVFSRVTPYLHARRTQSRPISALFPTPIPFFMPTTAPFSVPVGPPHTSKHRRSGPLFKDRGYCT